MDDEKNIVYGPAEIESPADISYSDLILQRLKEGGSAIAQICAVTGDQVTYEEIRQKSIRLAIALQKLGVKKGDVVAIAAENRFEFSVSAIAIMSLGAINATLNIVYSTNELIHAMNISKPKMVFCSPFAIYNVMDVMKEVPSIKQIITYGDEKPDPSVILFEDLFKEEVDITTFKTVEVDPMTHPIAILCSSGTTGLPKGVILTHNNFTVCTYIYKVLMADILTPSDCFLTLIPWFHAYGFVTHLGALSLNVRTAFLVRFEEDGFLSAIEKYKVTFTVVVPPLLVFLAKHPLVDKYDLTSFKEIWCGAAPLSKELQVAVTNRIGVKDIRQGYGLTETTLAVCHNRSADIKYGSCGQVVPGTKAKVIDQVTGKALGPNQEGELCFKGPLMMLGYIGDAASTEHIFDSDGWLHTGDIGYYDNDEFFYIVDRLKELIKYKGFQVPPAELEALLLQHPSVKDAGVVGLPDEVAGELPLAFIVLQPDVNTTEKNIIDFVAKQVSQPKRLHGGVRFVDEIPKSPSGKILRRELKDLLNSQLKSKL